MVKALASDKFVDDKYLRINMASLKDVVLHEGVSIQWVESSQQVANSLTKQGASAKNLKCFLD